MHEAIQMKVFDLHENEAVSKIHDFHMKGFAPELMSKRTRKWPVAQLFALPYPCRLQTIQNIYQPSHDLFVGSRYELPHC